MHHKQKRFLLARFVRLFAKLLTKKEEIGMPGTTLCVVDMQPGFNASENIINEVIKEIELAKRRKDGIVFIELNPEFNGSTHKVLLDSAHMGGYEKIAYATKHGGDGSSHFIDTVGASGWFPLKRVRVCGVNRGACVRDTVKGLVRLMSKSIGLELAFSATAPGPRTWTLAFGTGERESFEKLSKDGVLVIK